MSPEIQWLIGAAFALVSLIGGIVMRDRHIAKSIKDGDDVLHQRVNRIRDEFVRKADLDGHIQRLETEVASLRQDQREATMATTQRLDKLYDFLVKQHESR